MCSLNRLKSIDYFRLPHKFLPAQNQKKLFYLKKNYIADSRVFLQAVRALVRPPTEFFAAEMAFLYLSFSAVLTETSALSSSSICCFSAAKKNRNRLLKLSLADDNLLTSAISASYFACFVFLMSLSSLVVFVRRVILLSSLINNY